MLRQMREARRRTRDRLAAGALDGQESRARHPAEHDHHAQPLERLELTQEIGPTVLDLARRQAVPGRRAACNRAHEGVLETETVVAPGRRRLVGEARAVERRVEPVAALVARED